jgi:hypothetical protein
MEESPKNDHNEFNKDRVASLALFNRSHHFAFIFKKTEKLVTAVYMITNFIKDSEPLKERIRKAALELLSLNIAFTTVSLRERRELIREYQAISLEIVSLSSIAYHSGLISEMNFHILSREFSNLVTVIEKDENKKANEETVSLDPRFFDVAHETSSAPEVLPKAEEKNVFYRPHTGASEQGPDPKPHYGISKGHSSTEREMASRKAEYLPMREAREKAERGSDGKDSRKATILKLLSKKSGLGIKDFAESIKGCSEKTIQRELLAMVAAGTIKKEGERRWSTYSLAP